jgi:hypothetical protein
MKEIFQITDYNLFRYQLCDGPHQILPNCIRFITYNIIKIENTQYVTKVKYFYLKYIVWWEKILSY